MRSGKRSRSEDRSGSLRIATLRSKREIPHTWPPRSTQESGSRTFGPGSIPAASTSHRRNLRGCVSSITETRSRNVPEETSFSSFHGAAALVGPGGYVRGTTGHDGVPRLSQHPAVRTSVGCHTSGHDV